MSFEMEKMHADLTESGFYPVYYPQFDRLVLKHKPGAQMSRDLKERFCIYKREYREFVKHRFSALRCIGCELFSGECDGWECLRERQKVTPPPLGVGSPQASSPSAPIRQKSVGRE